MPQLSRVEYILSCQLESSRRLFNSKREFAKIVGPNTDPMWQGSHYKDSHKKGLRIIERAIYFL